MATVQPLGHAKAGSVDWSKVPTGYTGKVSGISGSGTTVQTPAKTVKTIEDYKRDYAEASARGDAAGMKAANDGANAIRAAQGQAAEYATEDIARVAASGMSGSDILALGKGPLSQAGVAKASGSGSPSPLLESGKTNAGFALAHAPEGTQATQRLAADTTLLTGAGEVPKAETPQYPFQFSSLDEMRAALGYDQVSDAQQRAIDAYIKQTENSLAAQKAGVSQAADEAARQAYIAYMQSRENMPQALSAAGYTGGMADSQALGLEATLQNNQRQILLNRDNALNDIDTAINNAKLEGSIQGAQAQAELGRDALSAFQSYINQKNAQVGQDFWQRYGYDFQAAQAQASRDFSAGQLLQEREWQKEDEKGSDALSVQTQDYQTAWNMILAGVLPSEELLASAKISGADAQAYVAAVQAQQGTGEGKPTLTEAAVRANIKAGNLSPSVLSAYEYYYGVPYGGATTGEAVYLPTGGGTQPSGSVGYDNGSLTPAQVKELQAYIGLTADGYWGQNSQNTTGLTADQAWAQYQREIGEQFDNTLNSLGRQYYNDPGKAIEIVANLYDQGKINQSQFDRAYKLFKESAEKQL